MAGLMVVNGERVAQPSTVRKQNRIGRALRHRRAAWRQITTSPRTRCEVSLLDGIIRTFELCAVHRAGIANTELAPRWAPHALRFILHIILISCLDLSTRAEAKMARRIYAA
jgi:hypothetical protein